MNSKGIKPISPQEPTDEHPALHRKYGRMHGSIINDRKDRLVTFTVEAYRETDHKKKNAELDEQQAQEGLNETFWLRQQITGDLGIPQHFEFPVKNVEQRLAEAKRQGFSTAQLQNEIAFCDAQIEGLKEEKQAPILNYSKEYLEDAFWNRRFITIRKTLNRNDTRALSSLEQVEEIFSVQRESMEIFDKCIEFYSELQKGYGRLLMKLKNEAQQPEIAQKLAELEQIVKEAEKCRKVVKRVIEKMGDHVKSGDAFEYSDNEKFFKKLQERFISLQGQLSKYGKLDIPAFPQSLERPSISQKFQISSILKKKKFEGDDRS